jgi:hypothetical protein
VRVSPSFFFRVPQNSPRTVCRCQPITLATSSTVAPSGRCFDRVVAANGGLDRVREFDRLFIVPGMNHCAGGAGAVNFGQSGVVPVSLDPNHDAILALQRWVEEGIAPDDFIATTDPQPLHARENTTDPATFTRLLCPFPEVARLWVAIQTPPRASRASTKTGSMTMTAMGDGARIREAAPRGSPA